MAASTSDSVSLSSMSMYTTPSTSLPPTPGTSASMQSFATAQEAQKKRGSYKPDAALRPDIEECRLALQLFLESRMLESEQLLKEGDPKLERLYISTGYGLIQSVKAFMSFEDKDLSAAIDLTRHGANLSQKHRKPVSITSRVAGFVVSGNSVSWFKSMTPVQRHAELVYAECLAQKAILGIVYSGDWLQFIKEAINMRSCIALYKAMYTYLEAIDAEAVAAGKGPHSTEVDDDFRSGVYLGMGVTHLVLSLLPGRIVPILEMFGYKGERKVALELLSKSGGWVKGEKAPRISREKEGLRRSLCDMVLLMFHLVMSGFTYDGVDIDMAETVLAWNAARYPSGVFFLFGQGRLSLFRAQPQNSIQFYTAGTDVVQEQFKSLQGISLWELAIAHLALWDVKSALKCWRTLREEAGWSKCVYTYGYAACAVQLINDGDEQQLIKGKGTEKEEEEDVVTIMESVPGLMKRIAGKSIPMEKFASRRARKFKSQHNRLLLPALEVAYMLLALPRTPRSVLINKILPTVDKAIEILNAHEGKENEYYDPKIEGDDKYVELKSSKSSEEKNTDSSNGYWDDYCLAHFFRGVCLRYVAYPDPYATVTEENPLPDAATLAKESFDLVLKHGPKIVYDHHIIFQTHYEYGKLEARNGNKEEAKRHIELVLSKKATEVNWNGRKGKYNLENALNVRANAALEGLDQDRLL